jgi:hypothetical protein
MIISVGEKLTAGVWGPFQPYAPTGWKIRQVFATSFVQKDTQALARFVGLIALKDFGMMALFVSSLSHTEGEVDTSGK